MASLGRENFLFLVLDLLGQSLNSAVGFFLCAFPLLFLGSGLQDCGFIITCEECMPFGAIISLCEDFTVFINAGTTSGRLSLNCYILFGPVNGKVLVPQLPMASFTQEHLEQLALVGQFGQLG